VYDMPAAALRRAVEEVGAALAAGALHELPAHRFGLDEIAAAPEAVEAGAIGKVLVDIG
jgi:NADPH:quinone reductase